MWVAVVQLWPADMANVFWCALWRTQPMETQGFRGNLPGLCWTVLDHRNAMAELVAQSRQSSAKKKRAARVFDESSSSLGEKDGMITQ